MSEDQYFAEVPEYVRLGGRTASGAGRSLSIAGGTNPILGRPSTLAFVRVKQAGDHYVPVNGAGEEVKDDLSSAIWTVSFDRYVKNGFQATVQDSDLQGGFPGVLIILVYPQTDMGHPTTPRDAYDLLLYIPAAKGVPAGPPAAGGYKALKDEARKEIEALLKKPADELVRGFLARREWS